MLWALSDGAGQKRMGDKSSLEELLKEVEELQRQLERLRGRLADALPRASLPKGTLSVLLCRVGEQRVGLALAEVSEVVLMAEVSPLPDAPPWVPGLLNLRGSCFPVLDVGSRFRRAAREPRLSDLIVICQANGRRLGLIVQEIHDVESYPSSSLGSIPEEASLAPFLLGVLRDDENPVLLLSIPRLLALTESVETQA